MDDEERLSVRLSSDVLLILSELVYSGKYASESEIVRVAVDNLIDSLLDDAEKEEYLRRAKARKIPDLSSFTSEGINPGEILSKVIQSGLESDRKDF